MIYFRERERVRKINVNEAKSQVETDNCWSDVFLEDYFSTAEALCIFLIKLVIFLRYRSSNKKYCFSESRLEISK